MVKVEAAAHGSCADHVQAWHGPMHPDTPTRLMDSVPIPIIFYKKER